MSIRRRLPLPSRKACARFSKEAALNARALCEVAKAAADLGHYGAAVSLEILALEEAAKAQALSWRARLRVAAEPEVNERVTRHLEQAVQRDHAGRHRFVSMRLMLEELERLKWSRTAQSFFELYDTARAGIVGRESWLDKADALKQEGL